MTKKRLIKQQPYRGKTALICGASKGIGKETAKEIVRLGGSVGIVARDSATLTHAAQEIAAERMSESQLVETITCDTTDMGKLKPLLETFIEKHGVPDVLINVVGYAYPNYIQELKLEDYRKNMETNYFGQVVPTLILLPHFMKEKKGQIAFTSSGGGFVGIIGYATYSPSKFALVGFAETLRHELKPFNIRVSVLYPPDTDTPGFEIENQTKPPETDVIVGSSAGLASPEDVAEKFVEGLLRGKFFIIWGAVKMFWILKRFSPKLVFLYGDVFLRIARKNLGKS
ncbi:MAG TPA: SDR family oxidoreductase [Anaerolineae bacterium]|nr:SDR family oxidoreductase [Anaerolineae bacterium]